MEGRRSVLDPIALGSERLQNRLGLGPINPGFARIGTERRAAVLDFYRCYAEGRLGLAYVGGVATSRNGRANNKSLVMTDTGTQKLLIQVVDIMESSGTRVAVQLMHAGRQASSVEIGHKLVAASAIACAYYQELPGAASTEDIRRIVKEFTASARAAAAADCKIVEVHAAHGYLLSGFLSCSSNKRTDKYGGSVANRFRLLREVAETIKNHLDVALGVRINVYERERDGLTLDEAVDGLSGMARWIDFVSVSAGIYTTENDLIIPRRAIGVAPWRSHARMIQRQLGLPVLIAGNIESVDLADDIVATEDADVVLMVRSLLADSQMLTKWLAGHPEQTQECTELYLCKYHSRKATHVYCPHNPVLRRSLRPSVER